MSRFFGILVLVHVIILFQLDGSVGGAALGDVLEPIGEDAWVLIFDDPWYPAVEALLSQFPLREVLLDGRATSPGSYLAY